MPDGLRPVFRRLAALAAAEGRQHFDFLSRPRAWLYILAVVVVTAVAGRLLDRIDLLKQKVETGAAATLAALKATDPFLLTKTFRDHRRRCRYDVATREATCAPLPQTTRVSGGVLPFEPPVLEPEGWWENRRAELLVSVLAAQNTFATVWDRRWPSRLLYGLTLVMSFTTIITIMAVSLGRPEAHRDGWFVLGWLFLLAPLTLGLASVFGWLLQSSLWLFTLVAKVVLGFLLWLAGWVVFYGYWSWRCLDVIGKARRLEATVAAATGR